MRALTNLFIIACCLSWLCMTGLPSPLQSYCLNSISPYLDQLGLVLRFNMFAPNAPKSNHIVEADITFADGSHKQHKFPTLPDYKTNFWDQQTKFRESTLYTWLWHSNDYSELKEAAARYVARQYNSTDNKPITISLYDTEYPITPPNKDQSSTALTKKQLLLQYCVQSEDLLWH